MAAFNNCDSYGRDPNPPKEPLMSVNKCLAPTLVHFGPPKCPPLSDEEEAGFDQALSKRHANGMVHLKRFSRRPPAGRHSADQGSVPGEMLLPASCSRIEEGHDPAIYRITSRKIRPLVAVTVGAGVCKVRELALPAVLHSDDVVHLVPGIPVYRRQTAILTALASAPACG